MPIASEFDPDLLISMFLLFWWKRIACAN
jgi:hypothetical protein